MSNLIPHFFHYLNISLNEAFSNLCGVKQRTLLSLLGIVVGACSITALISIGENASAESTRQYLSMGTNILVIQNGTLGTKKGRLLDTSDIEPIKLIMPQSLSAAPLSISQAKVSLNNKSVEVNIIGVTSELLDIAKIRVKSGRFISEFDRYETFAVLGSALATSLSKNNAPIPIGEKIRIDDYVFTVIGVLDNSFTSPLIVADFNYSIFIPIKSIKRTLSSDGEISNLLIKIPANGNLTEISARLSDYIETKTSNSAIRIETANQLIEGLRKQNLLFTFLLAGIATISLIVGGIGIMNVMLAGLSERKKEIGLRLAIGAKRRDILTMMIFESSALTLSGGVIGSLLGVVVAYFFAIFSKWTFSFSLVSLIISLPMSVLVGLFFGIYPAVKASKMSPINALNSD